MLAIWCYGDAVQIRSYECVHGIFIHIFISNMAKESISDVKILCIQDKMH